MTDILAISHSCLVTVNRSIYRELVTLGWSIELVIPQKIKIGDVDQGPEAKAPEDPAMHYLPITSSHPRLYTYKGLIKLLNKLKPKIVLLENGPASLLAIQLGHWVKQNNSKLILIACDNLLPDFSYELMQGHFKPALSTFLTFFLSNLVNQNINHIFVISSDGIKVMNKLGYTGRVSQIPLGYNPKLFFRNETIKKEIRDRLGLKETTIAYFGRLTYEKGVHILIEALSHIKDLPWQLLLDRFNTYTNPYCQKLQKLIEEKGLISRVVYFDASHDEMPAYMNAADIVVLPSISTPMWKEQYGRVAPEAMACGRLVIASDCGALPELIGEAGLVFPEKDVNKLIELLRTALMNTEIHQTCGILAERRAKVFLSITKQKDLMHDVLSKLATPSLNLNKITK